MKKETLKKIVKYVAWKSFGALIFVAVAGTSLWALAAFSEPTTGPAASIQDFATNVLGANNTDNSFDSSSVTANADGSVLERLEALEDGKTKEVTAGYKGYSANYSDSYCENLNTNPDYVLGGQSNLSETYSDWRIPTMEEIQLFKLFLNSTYTYYHWTRGQESDNYHYTYKVFNGSEDFSMRRYSDSSYHFCVR